MSKKLVLFDIDGTLIRHFGPPETINVGWYRFVHALNAIFHIDVIPDPKLNYHGSVDRAILFDIAGRYGITKEEFDEKWNDVKSEVIAYANSKETKQIYEAIPDAVALLACIRKLPERYYLGVLTGNVDAMAKWKLIHVGIDPSIFSLFVTSDEFEDRISLAKSVFKKVENEAGIIVLPTDVYVIGDAVGDIQCAQAIGAKSIIVTTGRHVREELLAQHPDVLVDTLMDHQVLDMLSIS